MVIGSLDPREYNFTEYVEMSISPDNNTMNSLDNLMMNGSDNAAKEPQQTQVLLIVEIIILIILCVVGLFGNLLTIVAIVRTNKLRITENYFLVNLALADIIVCVIIEPFYLLTLISGRWPFSSNTFCAILAAMAVVALSSSVLNLLAIAVNRYFCIVQNQRYATLYTTRRTIFYCVMIWVGSISSTIIPAGFGILGFDEPYLGCGFIDSDESWMYQTISMVILFTFSIITFVFCYYNIWKEAHMSSTRTKQCSSSNTTSQVCLAGSVGTLTKLQKHLSKSKLNQQTREIQVAKTSFIVLSAFIICWTPFVLLVVFDRTHVAPGVFAPMFILLELANSSINPFIYAWRNQQFRNTYKRIFTCRHFFEKSVKDVSPRQRTDDLTTKL
ncbi:melatonin receptor type 1A-like [Antedon mediterranea]|uniref:melatonin receptor type 1A-like n=1 Tax=Antedon mediterranea TaxID=105859 RepID=UPI003AF80F9C